MGQPENKMLAISMITLHLNGLYTPIKGQRSLDRLKIKTRLYIGYKTHVKNKMLRQNKKNKNDTQYRWLA